MPPVPGTPNPPATTAKSNVSLHSEAVSSAAVAQDFDATISYLEGLIPSLYTTFELVRALGHTLPTTPPPMP